MTQSRSIGGRKRYGLDVQQLQHHGPAGRLDWSPASGCRAPSMNLRQCRFRQGNPTGSRPTRPYRKTHDIHPQSEIATAACGRCDPKQKTPPFSFNSPLQLKGHQQTTKLHKQSITYLHTTKPPKTSLPTNSNPKTISIHTSTSSPLLSSNPNHPSPLPPPPPPPPSPSLSACFSPHPQSLPDTCRRCAGDGRSREIQSHPSNSPGVVS